MTRPEASVRLLKLSHLRVCQPQALLRQFGYACTKLLLQRRTIPRCWLLHPLREAGRRCEDNYGGGNPHRAVESVCHH
jgi:hypothetical protein